MKHYLLQLPNGYYVIVSSAIDYSVGDKFDRGTIVQVGIQIKEHGMHFNVTRVISQDIIPISQLTFDDWDNFDEPEYDSAGYTKEDR